jgi:hypothetical protein
MIALVFAALAVTAVRGNEIEPAPKAAGKVGHSFTIGDGAPRKHWYKDPKWWIGEGVITASIFADGYTTAHRPAGIQEGNHFLGTNPSTRKVAGFCLLDFGIQTSLHAGAWHFTHHIPLTDGSGYVQDALGWRIVGYTGVPAGTFAVSGVQAVKNYQLIHQNTK